MKAFLGLRWGASVCLLATGAAGQAPSTETAPPAGDTPSAPAPAAPQPAPQAAPAPSPAPAPATPPPATGGPPPHYYVEPPDTAAPPGGAPQPARPAAPSRAAQPGVYEPPPPGYGYGPAMVYEPPPPPEPRHVAPKYSLWLGGRLGWFVPFGNAWGVCTGIDAFGDCVTADAVSWGDYASSGPLFELDAGARLGRNYNVFLLWEHAQLGTGDADLASTQDSAETDYYAIGLRVSSDPDELGLLTELTLGYRRFRAVFEDGSELQLTDAPLEIRIGLGADIRLSRLVSLTPLATVGFGSFGEVEAVGPAGSTAELALDPDPDIRATHGWFTLQLGGHFDLLGSKK